MALTRETAGEFAGWEYWPEETFEYKSAGPFYFKRQESGEHLSAFRAQDKHLNSGGNVHGGCLMAFADFALFSIAMDIFDENFGVTVACNCEFLAGAKRGQLIEAKGEVLRAGGSLIFVRGIVTADGAPCLNFSGTLKRFKKASPKP